MRYFTLTELSKSDTARRHGISNQPDSASKANLYALVDNILDPLRAAYGKPITVNSGYRCQCLNRLVGGASTSQHLYGQAADIEGVGRSRTENRRLFELIQKLDLPFDQLINEFNFDWVHVSFRPNPRRQVLESKKKSSGKTYYVEISQNKAI